MEHFDKINAIKDYLDLDATKEVVDKMYASLGGEEEATTDNTDATEFTGPCPICKSYAHEEHICAFSHYAVFSRYNDNCKTCLELRKIAERFNAVHVDDMYHVLVPIPTGTLFLQWSYINKRVVRAIVLNTDPEICPDELSLKQAIEILEYFNG